MNQERTHEILIVDDNPENLRVLSAVLEREGYAVRAATSGTQALQTVEASEPDLLLLDVHLPEMNGLDVCRRIRQNSVHDKLPIVFLSALGDSFNKLQGFEAGGNDYMTKPFDADEVTVRVKTHLELRAKLVELEELRERVKRQDEKIERLTSQLAGRARG